MGSALVYLTLRSIRNNVVLRLRRLRQPRYLFIGLALLFYFGTMIVNRTSTAGWRIPTHYENLARIGAAVVFFLTMAATWILPSSRVLQFSLAEVNFLFPAPIARTQLLAYKIARLLIATTGVSLFFTLILGPNHPGDAAFFTFKTAVVLGVTGLYEAGVSLYRLNAKASSGASARVRLPLLVASIALMALTAWVLAVFVFADGAAELLRLIPVVALLFFACIVWVLRSDAAFEEEAAINADKLRVAVERFQRGQPRITSRRGTPFTLAPTGPAETAILWKNWLLFGRASKAWMVGLVPLLLIFVATGVFAGSGADWEIVPFLLLVVAGSVAVMGPTMVRTDLRRDLGHLVVIKTWPVPGAAIVRGELLAPAIALTLGATAAIVAAGALAPPVLLSGNTSLAGRIAFVLSATIVATAVILTGLVIQNAIAVTFPAWIRFRPGAGVEGIGQMMVVLYGGLFVLVLAALVPGGVAAIVMFVAGGILLPACVFSALLFVECFAATELVGRLLERTDLQDLT